MMKTPDDQEKPAQGDSVAVDTKKRQFTRTAVAASAVLFTLGNRPTWGHFPDNCISPNTAASWAGGANLSYSPDVDYTGYEYHPDVPGHPESHGPGAIVEDEFCPPRN